ncbi:unnamed protein product [Oikopleura dioica]|uniref:Uncharacterized protein n=2 Tax=Oikopleura dioica TaxID=34765 RepID=E4X4J8_OIKDI|nr:unnamed protein product [Oikopleura dioica]
MLELSACYDGALIQSREYFFVKYERDANFSFNADSKGFRCDSPDTCYKAPCSCPNSCESCYDIPNDGCATRWDSCENEVERSNNCLDGTFIESPGTEDGFQCAAQPKCVAKDECVTTTTETPTTTSITTTTMMNVCNDPEISDQCLAECRLNYLECRANCDSQICNSACVTEFADCESSCPCSLDCPTGCQDCPDHPLCVDKCKDAQINNKDYKICLNEAIYELVSFQKIIK